MIVTWGTMVQVALEAARQLAEEQLDIGVLDLRWLCPLDEEGLRAAVKSASGRVIVLHEAKRRVVSVRKLSHGSTNVSEHVLRLEVVRVATPDMRIPAAPILQGALLPTAAKVIDEVDA